MIRLGLRNPKKKEKNCKPSRSGGELYVGRKFQWFRLGLGHSSCLGFVLQKFLCARLFIRNGWFSESGNAWFSFFCFFCPPTIYFSVLLQIWQEINLRPTSPRQGTSLRPHTNKRPPTVHPTTLHSPFPPNHTLPTHHGIHLSHPPLALSTPQSHPPHGIKETFVQLCSPNIPLKVH